MLMDNQNVTPTAAPTPTATALVTYESLDAAKRTLVDFRALNGLIATDDKDAGIKKMTVDELAGKLDVNRKTLYDWQNSIPGFWEMVNQRRTEISPQSRLAKVEEVWYMKAVKGDWQHLNAWLLNYKPGYKTPAAKVEHEAGQSLIDLFKGVEQNQPHIIEARVTTSEPEQQSNA